MKGNHPCNMAIMWAISHLYYLCSGSMSLKKKVIKLGNSMVRHYTCALKM